MLFVRFNIILTSKLYIMNTKNKLPNVKLQKTSVIFMQLGLILALFSVYLIMEHESFYKPYALVDNSKNDGIDDETAIYEFEVVKTPKKKATTKKVVKIPVKQKPQIIEKFEAVKNETKHIEEAVLKTSDIDEKDEIEPLTVDGIDEVVEPDEPIEDFIFSKVEFAPEFPGCTGSKQEKMACFNEKISKIVQRNFNVDLAQDLGLDSGKKRINVQFVIDKQGNIVDVKVRAPHKRLEKEARRIVKLFPKMKPARQGLHSARVKYGLPILFNVEE